MQLVNLADCLLALQLAQAWAKELSQKAEEHGVKPLSKIIEAECLKKLCNRRKHTLVIDRRGNGTVESG